MNTPKPARVGDVIAYGETIAANVARFVDHEGDDSTKPLAVVDLDPEQQPAEIEQCDECEGNGVNCFRHRVMDVDLTPEQRCAREDAHGGHAWGGAFGRRWCDGFTGRAGVLQPAETPDMHQWCACTAVQRERDESHVEALHADQLLRHVIREHAFIGTGSMTPAELEAGHTAAHAESGPLVLTLPEVPAEAVALVDKNGVRWIRVHNGWSSDVDALTWPTLLADFGPVTVEVAAPRETRTWEQLEPAPADISELVDVEGHGRFRIAVRRQPGDTTYVHEDEHGATGYVTFTLGRLRELGEVREVLGNA